jgi:hypothetical protein
MNSFGVGDAPPYTNTQTATISSKSLEFASCSTANGADAIVRTYTDRGLSEVAHRDDAVIVEGARGTS